MIPSFARLGLSLATGVALSTYVTSTAAQAPGTFEVVGDTLVSAMMMFVGNDEKVYIIDKAEANPIQIDDHPAWGTVWDIKSRKATPMKMFTNSFCAAGLSMPNGSFAVFGGNAPVGPDGNTPKVNGKTVQDPTYKDYDGRKAIRILDPCTGDSAQFGAQCVWHDDVRNLAMQQERWYPGVESLPNGDAVIIGGMKSGGYVNRNWPDTDPGRSGGGAVPTFEFFPSRGNSTVMQLMIDTSGLNTYVHTYLMPSGLMFVQSYLKTILWDYGKNEEHKLPDMPNGIVRVYPGSAGVAMLPLTPKNGYTPTILFCGGSDLKDADWGNYTGPAVDTWDHPASKDCQRITPEPVDKSEPKYEKDDEMFEGRTMGQFVILPNGKLLMLNGATNGTAGYTTAGTPDTPADKMPFGAGLASGPTLQPAIYDPEAPVGKRWSNDGLEASSIARMYHSSALLLPDGSVFIAGSNPEGEYRPNATFPTEYRAEVFYPPYWNQTRPVFQGVPQSLTYGGQPFDIKIDATSYSGDSNAAAQSATAVIIRPGFSTHAMNMGQRFMQLNSTFSVADDGTITLHVSQLVPNANLVTPGPVLFFVNINGVPSVGKSIIVGSGVIQKQEMLEQAPLPVSILATNGVTGKAAAANSDNNDVSPQRELQTSTSGIPIGAIVGIAVGGGVVLLGLVALLVICMRRKNAAAAQKPSVARNITIARARPGTTLGFKDFSRSSGPDIGREMAAAYPVLGRKSPILGTGSGASPLLAAGFTYPGREGASSPDSVYSSSTRLSADPLGRR